MKNDRSVSVTPMKDILQKLTGLLSMPEEWKGKDIDIIIKESKYKYFKKKFTFDKKLGKQFSKS